jgi:hypothetical protein
LPSCGKPIIFATTYPFSSLYGQRNGCFNTMADSQKLVVDAVAESVAAMDIDTSTTTIAASADTLNSAQLPDNKKTKDNEKRK